MKKWLPVLIASLVVGCADTQHISTTSQGLAVVQSTEDLSPVNLDIPSLSEFNIDNSSQMLINDLSAGAVASFIIPGDRGSFNINLTSFVNGEESVYATNLLILNAQGKMLYQKTFDDFEYYPAKFTDPNKFVSSFTIIPDSSNDPLMLVVYTSNQDLVNTSTIIHPAKVFAEAKGVVPPNISDPKIKHVRTGSFLLELSPNEVVTKRVSKDTDYVPEANSESYYKSAIQKAVADNNIPKALSLLDEAKALNIDGAQEVFVKAVNAK